MSAYERKRWDALQVHWTKKAEPRQLLPVGAQSRVKAASELSRGAATTVGQRLSRATPKAVKEAGGAVVEGALVPTFEAVTHVLELLNDWIVELNDAEAVLAHHRGLGRSVHTLEDLRSLDLEHLDDFTRGMTRRWRTLGAGEGAALGALAMIPVPGVGSAAAITLDLVAMQVLTSAIATRVCYAYGFDASDPELRHMVDRMVMRAYRNQAPKTAAVKNAGAAFEAAKGRVNWSPKLRENHRLLEAVEKLMKQFTNGKHVPVQNARMGLPVIAIFVGAGTNAHILGDVAKQACNYAATVHLSEKYSLSIPKSIESKTDGSNVSEIF